MNKIVEKKHLYRGLSFYKGSLENFLVDMFGLCSEDFDQPNIVVTPNPEMIVEMEKNEEFGSVLRRANYRLVDGFGLWFFLKYFWGEKNLYRICGSDLFRRVLEENGKKEQKYKIFLLGAMPGVAEAVRSKYPNSNIVGVANPKFSLEEDEGEVICQKIVNADTDLLFLAFGAPNQEIWMDRFRGRLKSVKFVFGVGGAFDYEAGVVERAPGFLRRKIGFEWLFRLLKEPMKRWKRILKALVVFPVLFMRDWFKDKFIYPSS